MHVKLVSIELDTYALIDSGASVSTFKADIAESLGIKIEDGEKRVSVGISGRIDVFIHQVEIRIFENWFPCKVAFSRQLTSSFNLLGRQDFFYRHLITFNEKEKKTVVTEFE